MNAVSVDPVRHRFTVDEYYRMGDAGVFGEGDRVELLGGEIIQMSPIGSLHAAAVNRLNRLFTAALGNRAVVSVQNPVRLGNLSEPEPDVAVLRPRPDFYAAAHPRPDDVWLIVEVADTTIGWDRRVKRPLYAAAGIPEVWIVDLGQRAVEVATGPRPDGYAQVRRAEQGDTLAPGALGDIVVTVSDLVG